MIEEIDLKQIERNIFREYCQDGLADIVIGAYFFLLGLLLPSGTVAPLIALFVLFFVPLVRGLKNRYTYPRLGYVELRQGDPGPVPLLTVGSLVLGLIALIAVLIAVGAIGQPAQWYRWMPILFGIWFAGMFLGLGLTVRVVRYYVVAGVTLVGGPTFALLPLTRKLENIGLFFAAVGAALLVGGIVAFARFLRKHPLLAEEAADAGN